MMVVYLAATIASLAGASVVVADDAALEFIEPVVDRMGFERLLASSGLDDDQRLVADLLYSDYAASLDGLIERTSERADAAGRDRVQQALSGRVLMEPEELRRTRVTVLRAYAQSWSRADELFDRLVSDARGLVGESSAASFDRALVELRREVWLKPRAAAANDETYAGEGVDLVLLFEEATADGQELAALDPANIADALATWRQAVDALLRRDAEAIRAAHLERLVGRIERDVTKQRAAERQIIEHWRQLDQVNQAAAQRIADAAARTIGRVAADKWKARFDRACFPWLFRSTRPDKELGWIERRAAAEIRQQATRIMDAFGATHLELCREAIALMRQGRMQHGKILHARMDPSTLDDGSAEELYRELLKNSGRRSKLEADTSAALEALLTDRQRAQMASDIAAEAYGRRR
jgi:hypothetical protein